MRPIILASASPRRKELLTQLIGDTFIVEESDFVEDSGWRVGGKKERGELEDGGEGEERKEELEVGRERVEGRGDLQEITVFNSREKARAVAKGHSAGIVIGADTVVLCDGDIFGKPGSEERAVEMLRTMGGRGVDVVTGVTVIDCETGREISEKVMTRVFMDDLDEKTIRSYVATGEPLDKAGAFGIQGKGAVLVEGIEGDYFNVVGLPLFTLARMLKMVGVDVFSLP